MNFIFYVQIIYYPHAEKKSYFNNQALELNSTNNCGQEEKDETIKPCFFLFQ